MSFLDIPVRKVDSSEVVKIGDLCPNAKAILCVNVASEWGYTPHYGPYQAMYSALKANGLQILAFPCN